ncbi:MAG: efflux RND transporter periplasmic adaptor subunit [Eubacteriales bacterium]|nr:efflux RND transporter periplasmic adaptor subunit [Eubacteriales bacterium]
MKADQKKQKKIPAVFLAVVLVLALAAGVTAWYLTKRGQEREDSREAAPEVATAQGQTSVVTEEGSISVGTKSQVFELDLSEFTGDSSFSWQSGDAFPQMNMGSSSAPGQSGGTDSSQRQLTVEEVYVEAGQEVKAGDPILKVTEDTLEQIRSQLEEDVEAAKEVYDQAATAQKQTESQAEANLRENQMYGQYADTEYNLAVQELSESVSDLEEQIAEKQEELAKLQEELADVEEALAEQQDALDNAVYLVENQDRLESTYGWLVAVNTKEDIESAMESLKEEQESGQDSVAELEEELESLNRQLLLAQRELAAGTIEAEGKRQTRQLDSQNAQEIYDVETGLAAFDTETAQEDYQEAADRLEELDGYLAGQILTAQADGVVTDVLVAAGDSLQKDTELISYNSYDEVTVTLSIDEADMDRAALGSRAEVTVSAFPDEVFEAEVTEIGDAQINSNTNTTTYEVTVTITQNASKLYEGMTATVTFLGKE